MTSWVLRAVAAAVLVPLLLTACGDRSERQGSSSQSDERRVLSQGPLNVTASPAGGGVDLAASFPTTRWETHIDAVPLEGMVDGTEGGADETRYLVLWAGPPVAAVNVQTKRGEHIRREMKPPEDPGSGELLPRLVFGAVSPAQGDAVASVETFSADGERLAEQSIDEILSNPGP